jgi:hypothetical protein
MSAHLPVEVRRRDYGFGLQWGVSCENRAAFEIGYFDTFVEAIAAAREHASQGDGESRFCPDCQKYKPTCNDYCLECGANT